MSRDMDRIKGELIGEYAMKQVVAVRTFDGISYAPDDLADEDGDMVCVGRELDLRGSPVPVRVSIQGVEQEEALRLLTKILKDLPSLWDRGLQPDPPPRRDEWDEGPGF